MSKTLAELEADVLTVCKRPDLMSDITMHTKNALLKAHQSDYYLKDLTENAFVFGNAETNYSLDIKTLVPRFRKMKYLNVIDATTREIVRKLTPLDDPNLFLDGYGYKKDYTFYEAGDLIQIRCSGQETHFGFGCFLYPDTTLMQQSSWIADMVPFAIVYEAARTLYRTIGRDDQSRAMELLVAEAIAEVKQIGIPTIGE